MTQTIFTKNSNIKTFEALKAALDHAQKTQPNETAAIAAYAPALTGDVSESRKYVFFIHKEQLSCLPIRAIEVTEESPIQILIDWQLHTVSEETDADENKNYILKSSEEPLEKSTEDRICQKLVHDDFSALARIIKLLKNLLIIDIRFKCEDKNQLSDSVLDKIVDFSMRTANATTTAKALLSLHLEGFSVETLLEKAEALKWADNLKKITAACIALKSTNFSPEQILQKIDVFASAENPLMIGVACGLLEGVGFQSEHILENIGALSDEGLFNTIIKKHSLTLFVACCKQLRDFEFQPNQILQKIAVLAQAQNLGVATAICVSLKRTGFDANQVLDSFNKIAANPCLLGAYCVKNGGQTFNEVLIDAENEVVSLNLTQEEKMRLDAIYADFLYGKPSLEPQSNIRGILVNAKDLRSIAEAYSSLKNAGFPSDLTLKKIDVLAHASYPDLVIKACIKLKAAGFRQESILQNIDVLEKAVTQVKSLYLVYTFCIELEKFGFLPESVLEKIDVLVQEKNGVFVYEICIDLKKVGFPPELILEKIDELSQKKDPTEFKFIFERLLPSIKNDGALTISAEEGKTNAEKQSVIIHLICQYLRSGGSASQFHNEITANKNATGFFNRKIAVYSPIGILFKAVYQSNQRHNWSSTSVSEECFSGKDKTLREMIEKLQERLHEKVKGLSSVINSNERDKRLEQIKSQATYKTLSQLGLNPESYLTGQKVHVVSSAAVSAAGAPVVPKT